MDKLELIGEIQTALINYSFYLSIEDDIKRLIGLVQDNQDFFGNPPAGQSCIKLATDKLEKTIELHRLLAKHSECLEEIEPKC